MGIIKYLNLSRDISPSTRINKTENKIKSPCNGKIINFVIHFPSGTDNLLGIFCGARNEHLTPTDGEIRMDETTVVLPVNFPVKEEDYIWAGIINYSSENTYRAEIYAAIECCEEYCNLEVH